LIESFPSVRTGARLLQTLLLKGYGFVTTREPRRAGRNLSNVSRSFISPGVLAKSAEVSNITARTTKSSRHVHVRPHSRLSTHSDQLL